ncbi:unnamed protein product [Bathycoccus prasinos]
MSTINSANVLSFTPRFLSSSLVTLLMSERCWSFCIADVTLFFGSKDGAIFASSMRFSSLLFYVCSLTLYFFFLLLMLIVFLGVAM